MQDIISKTFSLQQLTAVHPLDIVILDGFDVYGVHSAH